jgi:tetratricopeptide (TPR) repeat protein
MKINKILIILSLLATSQFAQSQNHPFYSLEKANQNVEFDIAKYQGFFFEGLRLKTLGDFDGALQQFMACLSMNGKDAASMYEVAYIYMLTNQSDQALFFIESACQIDKENVWYQQLLASVLVENQKYSKALATYEKLLELDPFNQDWFFEIARSYLLSGQPKNAIKTYNRLEKIIGLNEPLIQQKKNILLEIGDKKGAINEIKKLLELDSTNLQALNDLAQTYSLLNNTKAETETLERILEIDPTNGTALLILSDTYRANGETEKAFDVTKKAFQSTSLNIDSKMRRLLSYYDLGTDTSILKYAFELIEVLKQTHPSDAKPFTIAGDYYYRSNEFQLAATNFEKALEFDPSRYPIWQQLMIIYFDFKDYEKVASLAQRCLELFPSQTTAYYFSGLANLQLKNYEKSIKVLETGLFFIVNNNPLKGQFYTAIGDAFHGQEDHEESDKAYSKALEIDPNDPYVLNNYSYYLSLRSENLEQARIMMQNCVELKPGVSSYEDTYAWVFFKLKDYQNALKWLEKAMESGGDASSTIVEHYGDVLFFLGKKEAALVQWIKAKELGSASSVLDKKIQNKKWYE